MKTPVPGGLLIAIEGIDGAGKTLQARTLAAALEARGFGVVLTREPTDGPWGRILRASAISGRLSPQEELDTFLKDREQHVRERIRPALAEGRIVITDRYYFSTMAYQGARGFDPEALRERNEAIAVEPDLLLLIDLDPAVSLARIGRRDGRGNEFETLAQLTRTREIFRSVRKPYLVTLDGNRPEAAVAAAVLAAVDGVLAARLGRVAGGGLGGGGVSVP